MNKNIIILSDGTGNGSAKRHKTNVLRLYDTLDLHRKDQIAFYDDGVGSQEFLPLKLIGGAFGWGLKRNIRELYKFLCRTYKEGDRIYLFGFSRGAFTVRMLSGMLDYCGIYTDYTDEQHLNQVAKDNYNAFRSHFKTGLMTRGLRAIFGKTEPMLPHHCPEVEFIGVWDTVDAYGLPIDELAIVWDRLVYPIYFPDYKLSRKVRKACHAVSVDDERLTFHPVLWDESCETDPARIEQVWFPGVHSDVGGGYPKHTLSLVALDWMISRAEAQNSELGSPGLHLIQQWRDEFSKHSDWHGPQHDSRALAGAYYRYKPRDIERLCRQSRKGLEIKRPKIHCSVMERIADNVIPYAPTGLPEDYEVVATRGPLPVYETPDESKQRKVALQPVQKIIRQRQWLYYALLMTSLLFLLSPIVLKYLRPEQCITSIQAGSLLEKALPLLPNLAAPWIKVLWASAEIRWSLILIFSVLFFMKKKAWTVTQQRANNAWAVLKKKNG